MSLTNSLDLCILFMGIEDCANYLKNSTYILAYTCGFAHV